MRFDRLIQTVDVHTAGEPLRIIISGVPPVPGATILEKRRYLTEHWDAVRTFLMLEPRGHSGMYGCLVTPPVTPDGDFGVIFMHNEGYSTMCGHGIIAVAKAAVETGMVAAEDGERLIRIDAPAGRITARVVVEGGRAADVSFANVPSFVLKQDLEVDVPGVGMVPVDVAFGGAFYAYVDADRLGVAVRPANIDRLVALGTTIKGLVSAALPIVHPLEPDLGFLYGTIICEPVVDGPDGPTTRNVCIFADAQIDRSPTGTGTSGRLALLHAKGVLRTGTRLINRSVIDTAFWGRVTGVAAVGDHPAVETDVGGAAHIMGFHQFVLEPDDPLPAGFRITGG